MALSISRISPWPWRISPHDFICKMESLRNIQSPSPSAQKAFKKKLTLCSTKVNKATHVNFHYSNRLLPAENRSGCGWTYLLSFSGPVNKPSFPITASEVSQFTFLACTGVKKCQKVSSLKYLSLCVLQGVGLSCKIELERKRGWRFWMIRIILRGLFCRQNNED